MHISKKVRIAMAILVGGIVVASSACSADSIDQTTAPQSSDPAVDGTTAGTFGPSLPDMSKDGTYGVAIDPSVAHSIARGEAAELQQNSTPRTTVPHSSTCSPSTRSIASSSPDT